MKDIIQEKSLILANTVKKNLPATLHFKGMKGFMLEIDLTLVIFVKKHSLIQVNLNDMKKVFTLEIIMKLKMKNPDYHLHLMWFEKY